MITKHYFVCSFYHCKYIVQFSLDTWHSAGISSMCARVTFFPQSLCSGLFMKLVCAWPQFGSCPTWYHGEAFNDLYCSPPLEGTWEASEVSSLRSFHASCLHKQTKSQWMTYNLDAVIVCQRRLQHAAQILVVLVWLTTLRPKGCWWNCEGWVAMGRWRETKADSEGHI